MTAKGVSCSSNRTEPSGFCSAWLLAQKVNNMGFRQYDHEDLKMLEPRGYAEYMSNYGEHFSKALCEWAVSRMEVDEKQPNGEVKKKRLEPWNKEQVEGLLKQHGVTLQNDKGYDKVYVANMCKADFLGDSVPDEAHVAKYVKDVLDDPDGYDGIVFNRFVADCQGSGTPINWSDML